MLYLSPNIACFKPAATKHDYIKMRKAYKTGVGLVNGESYTTKSWNHIKTKIMSISRKRIIRLCYGLIIVSTIIAGLFSRSKNLNLPHLFTTFGGDVLYATCVFFTTRFVALNISLKKIVLIGIGICVVIETLQLYHAPWIENIRHTRPFGLLLGYGFVWSDILCYGVGIALGWLIAFFLEKKLRECKTG